jgi:AraC family transcriptional regulator
LKASQRARYAAKIEKVLAHLVTRLESGTAPDLSDLSSAAGLSEYHFHRVFRLMTGETPASVVQRLRLAVSLSVLSLEGGSIAEATAEGAYSTTQSYARALKARAGLSPAQARGRPAEMARLQEQLRRPAAIDAAASMAPPLDIEIISFQPLSIVALRNVGDYRELHRAYAQLFSRLPDPAAVTGLYGIPYDDPRDTDAHHCRFDCCVSLADIAPVKSVPMLRELRIDGGTCARLRHTGSYDLIWNRLDSLYFEVMNDGAWRLGAAPAWIHYLDDPDEVAAPNRRADLHLPVTAETA